MKDHTFVICAYGESEYLEECILSTLNQSIRSNVMIATSTNNNYIRDLGTKYDIVVRVNNGAKGITRDWNFALSQADTKFVTIAHQDDVYDYKYAETIVNHMLKAKAPIIGFSDYYEIRGEKKVDNNKLLKIKKVMLIPLRYKSLWNSVFIRRRILSLGSAICCPCVTYCIDNIDLPLFQDRYQSDEDWEAWEKLSRQKGAFVYVPNILMGHRIHCNSETTRIIGDGNRTKEDYEMFCKFWPSKIAKILNRLYSKAEKSNEL